MGYNYPVKNVITVAQSIISVLIIGLILLQAKGTGFGTNFSSGSYLTKRGAEKIAFTTTIVLVIVWLLLAVTVLFP